MGIGAFVVRGAAVVATGGLLYATVLNPVMDWVRKDNMVVEQGYVSPKSLSVQGKKNGTGNIETYLQYKSGDETVSLPVMKGPQGPLVGTVGYWWNSIGASQREELTVGEWPAISNDAKHNILSGELQVILDTFYGTNSAGSTARGLQQPQYQQPKQQK